MPRKQKPHPPIDPAVLANPSLHKANGKAPRAVIAAPVGVTGLKRWGDRGPVWEEFLQELRGSRGIKVYREMLDNDATIGAVMYIITVVLRQVKWDVRGDDDTDVEFIEQCLVDMRPSFTNFICEVLSMLGYGWSWHEIVWKRRNGPNTDPRMSSKFSDGRIGWSCWDIRSQDSLFDWIWDQNGNLLAMAQRCQPDNKLREIPLSRSMLFRPTSHKNSPEGRSLLRSAYTAWYYKKHFRRIQGIGVERELAGMPVCYVEGTLGATIPEGATETVAESIDKILRNIRNDEQHGIRLPGERDDKGNRQCELVLLSSSSTKHSDVDLIIKGLSTEMAQVMAADFLQLGHEKVGSFALSDSKTGMFSLSLGAILQAIADVINDNAIPQLMLFNGRPVENCPQIVPGDIESPDLDKLGKYFTDLASAGFPLFPNEALESYALKAANLPEPTEEERATQAMDAAAADAARQAMADQQAAPPNPDQQMADELL